MEVFIKGTVVLATYLEEDNVLLGVFQLCYVLTRVMFRNGRPTQLISYSWGARKSLIIYEIESRNGNVMEEE